MTIEPLLQQAYELTASAIDKARAELWQNFSCEDIQTVTFLIQPIW